MSVVEVANTAQIAALLNAQPVVNAYALGYLDARYEDACRWIGWRDSDGTLASVVLVYTGLSRAGLFTAGQRDGIRPIFRELRDSLPSRAVAHIPKDHRDAIASVYEPASELKRMHRMGLRGDEFIDPGESSIAVDVLSHRDTAQILALYRHWPDNFFEPYQLESGLYFGVRDEAGEVASIAGIHNLSETFDVAAIGNLVTHPDRRGRGYARACTAALLRATFQRVSLVTLDVQEDNEPAKRTYRRFGFSHFGDFFEGELVRR